MKVAPALEVRNELYRKRLQKLLVSDEVLVEELFQLLKRALQRNNYEAKKILSEHAP